MPIKNIAYRHVNGADNNGWCFVRRSLKIGSIQCAFQAFEYMYSILNTFLSLSHETDNNSYFCYRTDFFGFEYFFFTELEMEIAVYILI